MLLQQEILASILNSPQVSGLQVTRYSFEIRIGADMRPYSQLSNGHYPKMSPNLSKSKKHNFSQTLFSLSPFQEAGFSFKSAVAS